MYTTFTFLALPFLLVAVQPGEIKPAQAQVKVGEDNLYSTVAELEIDQGNFIPQSAVIIDHEGYAWILSGAKVQSQKMAAADAKGPIINVTRTSKGVGLIVTGIPQWKMVNRASISVPVLPCMSWEVSGAPPAKSKTKGGQ